MTQEIRAKQIVDGIIEKKLEPSNISDEVRKLCVAYLHDETEKTQEEIAEIFQVSRSTIVRDLRDLKNEMMSLIAPFETEKVAKEMIVKAARVQGMAWKKGDLNLYWKVETDLIERLGKMGFIYYKGDPINIHIGDKKETHVTNVAIGAGAEEILGAITREIADINRLKEFLTPSSN